MRRMVAILGFAILLSLGAVPIAGATGERAQGALIDSTGASLGRVELEQEAGAVRVRVVITDPNLIRPGQHGLHFHAIGRCDTPDFASAGGHFNPTAKQHGAKNPQGPHAGDLPNLPLADSTRNRTGVGYTFVTTTGGITLSAGPASIFDADGTALVIHANPDDELTDPTGNSGGRVACAVLQPSAAPGLPNTGAGGATRMPSWWQAALLGSAALVAAGGLAMVARRRA